MHSTKMWLSKYALTVGLKEVGATLVDTFKNPDGSPKYASWGKHGFSVIGRDIHYTLEEAKVAAETKRQAKIKSLKKSLSKIEALSFTV